MSSLDALRGKSWLFPFPIRDDDETLLDAITKTNALLDLGINVTCPNLTLYVLDDQKPRPIAFWMDYFTVNAKLCDGIIIPDSWLEHPLCAMLLGVAVGANKPVYRYDEIMKAVEDEGE